MLLACIAALLGFALIGVHTWCEINCTRLDVATGRRDAGALLDDYGSNRGWYPRWKIPSILSMLAGIRAAAVFRFGRERARPQPAASQRLVQGPRKRPRPVLRRHRSVVSQFEICRKM